MSERNQAEVYQQAGFGQAVPKGTRPALVVVDFSYGFTDTSYPTAAPMGAQMAATARLAAAMRARDFPVIYTTIAYDPGELDRLAWLRKAAGMRALLRGTRLVEIDEAAGKQPDDPLISKSGASAFWGTRLAALLTSTGSDTVIVTGATTSGCVRATVVDAVQCGFNVLVPRDCCADRAQAPHEANLFDMGQKYAEVCDAAELHAWLETLAPTGLR